MPDQVVHNGIAIRELAGRTGTDTVGQNDTATRIFRCAGSTNPLACRQALLDADLSPLGIDIYSYDDLNIQSLEYATLSGPEVWQFTASYAIVPLTGDYTVAIDTGGGLVKRTSAYAQTAFPKPGFPAPDYGVSVDVQDKKVQGVDVIIPALKIDITAKLDKGLLTDPIGYAKTVASITGQVNNATYLTFAQGELLFAGATGDIIVDRDPSLVYTFFASQNVTGLQVGPIQNITKAGHDYIWFKYTSSKSNNYEVATPAVAYVSRVYGQADFGILKIGSIAPAAMRLASMAYAEHHRRTQSDRQRRIRLETNQVRQQFLSMSAAQKAAILAPSEN